MMVFQVHLRNAKTDLFTKVLQLFLIMMKRPKYYLQKGELNDLTASEEWDIIKIIDILNVFITFTYDPIYSPRRFI